MDNLKDLNNFEFFWNFIFNFMAEKWINKCLIYYLYV